MPDQTPMPDSLEPIEPIAPEEARLILEDTMRPYLTDGWVVLAEHDYMARLTKERQNIEIYVDLLGDVTIDEKPLSPFQESGRLVAWLLLVVAVLLALALANALGWL